MFFLECGFLLLSTSELNRRRYWTAFFQEQHTAQPKNKVISCCCSFGTSKYIESIEKQLMMKNSRILSESKSFFCFRCIEEKTNSHTNAKSFFGRPLNFSREHENEKNFQFLLCVRLTFTFSVLRLNIRLSNKRIFQKISRKWRGNGENKKIKSK